MRRAGNRMSKKRGFSRRDFVRSGALVAAACAATSNVFSQAQQPPSTNEASPIRLGLASYTFRNFSRAQMIGFMKQLNVFALNVKDVKDHLRMDPRIGCCIDVGHTVRAGADVVQAIHEAGPRLFNVHMKDLTNFQSKESQ